MSNEFNFTYLCERVIDLLNESDYHPFAKEKIKLSKKVTKELDKNPTLKAFFYKWYKDSAMAELQKLNAKSQYGLYSVKVGGNAYRLVGDRDEQDNFIANWIGTRGQYGNTIK